MCVFKYVPFCFATFIRVIPLELILRYTMHKLDISTWIDLTSYLYSRSRNFYLFNFSTLFNFRRKN